MAASRFKQKTATIKKPSKKSVLVRTYARHKPRANSGLPQHHAPCPSEATIRKLFAQHGMHNPSRVHISKVQRSARKGEGWGDVIKGLAKSIIPKIPAALRGARSLVSSGAKAIGSKAASLGSKVIQSLNSAKINSAKKPSNYMSSEIKQIQHQANFNKVKKQLNANKIINQNVGARHYDKYVQPKLDQNLRDKTKKTLDSLSANFKPKTQIKPTLPPPTPLPDRFLQHSLQKFDSNRAKQTLGGTRIRIMHGGIIEKRAPHSFELMSHKGKSLGKFPSYTRAIKREQQINYFKSL